MSIDEYERKRKQEIQAVIENKNEVDFAYKKLIELERGELYRTGVRSHSGGFADAEIYDEEEDRYLVELKWGIQNDVENVVHTEHDWYIMKEGFKKDEE